MIDFTTCPVNKFKGYGGANGNKINIMYNVTSYEVGVNDKAAYTLLINCPIVCTNFDFSIVNKVASE